MKIQFGKKAAIVTALLIAALMFSAGCASRLSKSTIVLEYSDFGPQAMAYRIIGRKRMPWAPELPVVIGEHKILVVVYRGINKSDVEEAFVADKDNNVDYRYVAYADAVRYLDTQIAQNILRKVTLKLEATRTKLLTKLGD